MDKNVGDALSISTAVATLAGWLPSIAALLTIVWTIMRIVNEWDAFKAKIIGWFGGGK